MIFGMTIESATTVIVLVILSVVQIYCTITGRTDNALKIEKAKEKTLKKLRKKQEKTISKAEKITEKIKENEKNVSNT